MFQTIGGHISKTVRDRESLVLITNKKLHIGFQITCKSSTSDDFEGHWQTVRSAILATAGLLVLHFETVCEW